MSHPIDMESICSELQAALGATDRLQKLGENFPALYRNAERALASLKMLQINISDLYELGILDTTFQGRKAAGDGQELAGAPGGECRT